METVEDHCKGLHRDATDFINSSNSYKAVSASIDKRSLDQTCV